MIQAFLNFLIVSVVMFLVVRAYNRFRDIGAPEGPPEDVVLLREIRDELRASGRGPIAPLPVQAGRHPHLHPGWAMPA